MIKGRKIIKYHQDIKPKIDISKLDIKPVVVSSVAGLVTTPIIKKKEDKEKKIEDVKKEDISNSKLPGSLIALLIFIVSIYVAYDQFFAEKTYNKDYDSIKLFEDREYVYFEDEQDFVTVNNKKYPKKDIVININNSSIYALNKQINSSNNELYNNYTYSGENACSSTSSLDEENKYLSEFSYREYTVYESNIYISIITNDKKVNVCGEETQKVNTYIIEKETGKVINDDELFNEYDTNINLVIKKAINNRVDGEYNSLDQESIVKTIKGNNPKIYVNSNNCLSIYYQGIGKNDYVFKDIICNK